MPIIPDPCLTFIKTQNFFIFLSPSIFGATEVHFSSVLTISFGVDVVRSFENLLMSYGSLILCVMNRKGLLKVLLKLNDRKFC